MTRTRHTMKLKRKKLTPAFDTSATLHQLERTMLASIAVMKRLRQQQRRQLGRLDATRAREHQTAQPQHSVHMPQ